MPTNDINRILRILKRDSSDATYRFAILRGMIDVIEQAPFRFTGFDPKDGVFPLGLLVERWIYYYLPLVQKRVTPTNGGKNNNSYYIAFRSQLAKAISRYDVDDALSAFHFDYTRRRIQGPAARDFLSAACKIAETIANMPMRYLGRSAGKGEYSVVKPSMMRFGALRTRLFDEAFLRASFGTYRISPEYLEPLRQLGSILVGSESILWQWAEFTANIRGNDVDAPEVLRILNTRPSAERDVKDARRIYSDLLREKGEIPCVWCGKPIRDEKNLAVDHVIPFSLWGDDGMTNLMPCHKTESIRKGDRIPAPELIVRSRERIVRYLALMRGNASEKHLEGSHPGTFLREERHRSWEQAEDQWITALADRCRTLISIRGHTPWP